MTVALWLLAIQGVIGAFDTLYYHEWRARLPARGRAAAAELALHAARDFLYAILFATLPFIQWRGMWVIALAAVLVAEIILTLWDFIVEIAVRRTLGDVYAGERVTHAIMGILYGAMIANLIPAVMYWWRMPSGLVKMPADVPLFLRESLLVMAIGVFASGVRDLYAALGLPHGGWPWSAMAHHEAGARVIHRHSWHRAVFVAAGLYNLAWGGYSIIDPQWLFRLAHMPPLNHPQVFACLGMVIGVYGLLYLEVARIPERGWPIAAVGLLGKILGPIGMTIAIMKGEWPFSAMLIVCVCNDFVWWIPFAIYLHDAWRMYRADQT